MSYSTSNSTFTDRKSNRQKPCKVLLICAYETIIFQLTNQLIFQKFSPFGSITKILIFEKGEVTKFFIEFGEIEQASNAKVALDGTKFFENICKMNIYFSNFNNVDLKHESTEGADYQIMLQRKNRFIQSFDNLTKSSQQQNIDFLDDEILMQTFSVFGTSNNFARSKTDNPKTLQSQILKYHKQEKFNMIQEEDIDRSIKKQIHSLLSQSDIKDTQSQWSKSTSKNSPRKQISINLKQQFSGSINQNTVLSYDLKQQLPLRQIYNLFSNFGNIECIVNKKNRVYIKFRSGYFAAVTMNYLDGMHFCGNNLNLKYIENFDQYLPKPLEYSESMYFDQSFDRFTPKRSITVNPPSETLHVSSIKKQNCNQHSLRKIFSEFGYVQKVKILMQSNQKNMALIRYGSLKQSFQAISELHNKQFGGRRMQISFTKSKL